MVGTTAYFEMITSKFVSLQLLNVFILGFKGLLHETTAVTWFQIEFSETLTLEIFDWVIGNTF